MTKAFKIIEKIAYIAIILAAVLLVWSVLPIKSAPKLFMVLSGSMEPAIHVGSVVIMKPAGEYKVGDVVVFGKNTRTEIPTTHRIISNRVQDGTMLYSTQGDANNSPDGKEISRNEIHGRVLFSVPFLGYILDFIRKPLGLVIVIVLPGIFIVYDEIRKITAEISKIKRPI